MDDLIRRQAAIKAVESLPNCYNGYSDTYDKSCIIGLLEELQSAQQEWIPCSERMPEEKDAGILKKLGTNKMSDYVIATVEVKGERMTVTACTYDGVWYWDMKYAFPDFKVVAWMPLPEPYKEDNNG